MIKIFSHFFLDIFAGTWACALLHCYFVCFAAISIRPTVEKYVFLFDCTSLLLLLHMSDIVGVGYCLHSISCHVIFTIAHEPANCHKIKIAMIKYQSGKDNNVYIYSINIKYNTHMNDKIKNVSSTAISSSFVISTISFSYISNKTKYIICDFNRRHTLTHIHWVGCATITIKVIRGRRPFCVAHYFINFCKWQRTKTIFTRNSFDKERLGKWT